MKVRKLLAAALVLVATTPVMARVGGGSSYGGGGGGSSGGGGGGGGGGDLIFDLIQLLFYLIFDYPVVGLPILILIIAVIVWIARQPSVPTYSSGSASGFSPTSATDYSVIKGADANFSAPVFVDFLQLLYTRFQLARGKRQFDTVRAFIEPELLKRHEFLANGSPVKSVEDVVIGSIDVLGFSGMDTEAASVSVQFKVNYVEVLADGKRNVLYAIDRWVLRRQAGVQSLPPDKMRSLNCPNCGSNQEMDSSGICKSCGQVVNQGKFQWTVHSITTIDKGLRPPLQLSLGEEVGTDLPTRVSSALTTQQAEFKTRYADFSLEDFNQQVRDTFVHLQDIWAARTWEKARSFETDSLFNQHRFWMEKYLAEGLVNHLEEVGVNEVVLAKIDSDKFYDALTVRIFASMKDYTTDKTGKVVEGNASRPRPFSEYWTFIRSTGYTPKPNAGVALTRCPNCGSPLDISMTGVCKYCDSVITTGQFGWVVSSIQQDEEYRG